MHKGHRTLIKFLLLVLHTLDFLRKFALYTWHSLVGVSATSTVFQGNDLKLSAKFEFRQGMCIKVSEL